MNKTMIDYMKETPEVALKCIDNRKELTKKVVDFIVKKKYKKILFVACGSSYSIASRAMFFIKKYLGVQVQVMWPYTFLNYFVDSVEDDTLVILLSQSGCSTNTLKAAWALKAANKDVIALTNNVDAPIKNEVKLIASYGNTPGDHFVTKGMAVSTLFLMLVALESALALKTIEPTKYD